MINFFRKTRKKLADDNMFFKYARYAIGEIVLVVVGILIALQLNNWNEERKRSSQEHSILLSLKSDFEDSKERLLFTMKAQSEVVRKSNALIQIHQGTTPLPPNDSIKDYMAFGAFGWYRAELITGAYDALLNSGNSELIKNRDLIRKLAEYHSIVNSGFEDQENSMNLLNNLEIIAAPVVLPLALPILNKRVGLDMIASPKEDEAIEYLMDQDAFFGHLYEKTLLEHLRYTIQQDVLARIEDILSILNNELGARKITKD
jgi:hypothetical protein